LFIFNEALFTGINLIVCVFKFGIVLNNNPPCRPNALVTTVKEEKSFKIQ
jgi:hypothetical protein